MAIDCNVRWFTSDLLGAPVLSGTAGALIALIDACRTGFGTKQADSLVVADGVATVNFSSGNAYPKWAVVRVSGAVPESLNGDWRVSGASANAFTFACPGIADVTIGSGVQVMFAPIVGLSKPFADTNKAAYRFDHVEGSGFYLRVDESINTRWARVRAYEEMADIDNGNFPFPTFEQLVASSYLWRKSDVDGSASRKWTLVADDRMMYFAPYWYIPNSYATSATNHFFGDFDAWAPANSWPCMVSAYNVTTNLGWANGDGSHPQTTHGRYMARNNAGTTLSPEVVLATIQSSAVSNGSINALRHNAYPCYLHNSNSAATQIIGRLPGYLHAPERALQYDEPFAIVERDDGSAFLRRGTWLGVTNNNYFAYHPISENWR